MNEIYKFQLRAIGQNYFSLQFKRAVVNKIGKKNFY